MSCNMEIYMSILKIKLAYISDFSLFNYLPTKIIVHVKITFESFEVVLK